MSDEVDKALDLVKLHLLEGTANAMDTARFLTGVQQIHQVAVEEALRKAAAKWLPFVVGSLCPTCQMGLTRSTTGMVCQTCGHDYGKES